jgi:hypothetical protein
MSLLDKILGPKQSLPSHTKGIRMGNQPGSFDKQAGHLPNGKATAERATGVNAEDRNPIDPSMPTLTPP